MLRIKLFLSILVVVISFGFFVPTLQAVDLKEQVNAQLEAGVKKSGLSTSTKDPRIIAAEYIQVFLGLLTAIFLILIGMSSYWYITARGEAQKIEKATDTIRRAIIGLIVVIMAYSITYFVSKNVQKAVGLPASSNAGETISIV